MLCTPLLLDTHAIAPPVGAAISSVGNGVAIKVSIVTACRASGAMLMTAAAATVRTRRKIVFMSLHVSPPPPGRFPTSYGGQARLR